MKNACVHSVLCAMVLTFTAQFLPSALAEPKEKADSFATKQQPLFDRIQLAGAWKITKGDPNILVGVIDNGYDFFHPDLKGQLIPGMYYSGGFHPEIFTNVAHGTQVASIIVAKDNPPTGMVGLAPRCRVLTASQGTLEHAMLKMRLKFFKANPKATLQDFQAEMMKNQEMLETFARDWVHYQVDGAATAIRYLVDHEVKTINISGGLRRSLCPSAKKWELLEDAFAYAAKKEVVIVLAAGNNAQRWEDYPGKPETVIVVGASKLGDTRWEEETDIRGTKIKQGSNYGKRLTVMAPVENIVICRPHDERFYSWKDGPMGAMTLPFEGAYQVDPIGATSSAAPIVSSLVALIYSVQPMIDARSVVKIVRESCDDIGETGYDHYTGYGRVNFTRTLQRAREWKK